MTLSHPKLNSVLASGVFNAVNNFSELEEKIKYLSIGEDISNSSLWKGDVFEVFCEALILTSPILQAKKVWPKSSLIPPKIAEKLRLRSKDKGVDGLYERFDGKFISYQAKYYPSRSKLNYGDLGNFFGLSDRVDGKLIISNCIEIDKETKDREPQFFNKNNLDNLPDKCWLNLMSLFKKASQPNSDPIKPDPHQVNAIDDCLLALKKHNRFQFISACGTGKTLSSLWIAEKYKPKTVLYLVPSLALLEQTLSEWVNHAESHFPFLSVCSDRKTISYAKDEIIIEKSDLPFEVTTDTNRIGDWFNATKNYNFRVVFATYDSAKKVAEGLPNNFVIDLAFFDEAHKTAGAAEKMFTYALWDENLACAKRIFMTATPKIRKLQKNSDGDLNVLSMDNINIYGPVKHRFNFSTAAKNGVIVPFKILISQVNRVEIEAEKRRGSITEVDDRLLYTDHVAHQIALQQAQLKSKAQKILTFHVTNKDAKLFVDPGPIGIRQHMKNFDSYSVDGEMNTQIRKKILKEFSESNFGIVSNARCLTEGIDVPEIDLVYFDHPKKSTIDITQAVGRAIRKPRGETLKRFGYVVVPLFLERHQDEKLGDAVARTDFTSIAEVINSLRDQDDELNEFLRIARVQKGSGKGTKRNPLDDHIEVIGPEINLDILQDFVLAKIVDKLTPTWDEWFGQLITYLEDNGYAPEIKNNRKQKGITLADWCGQQRTNFNHGILSKKRIQLLDSLISIGWSWDPVNDRMIEMSRFIKDYCIENRVWHLDRTFIHNGIKLGSGLQSLRNSYQNGSLHLEAIKNLEYIPGWTWNNMDETIWHIKFENYKKWTVDNNKIMPDEDLLICNTYGIEDYNLRNWIGQQTSRYKLKHGRKVLTEKQISRFETEIPFWAWNSVDRAFKAYTKSIELLGLENVKVNTVCNNFPIDVKYVGRWLSKQRTHCKTNNFVKSSKLELKDLLTLEKIGFTCDPIGEDWQIGYINLLSYVDENKTSKVPQEFITKSGYPLGSWVSTARNKKVFPDFDSILKRLVLEKLPGWFENWSDKRTVDYRPASDQNIKSFKKAFVDHQELNNFLMIAIFSGIRITEIHRIKLKKFKSIDVIEVPSTPGVSGLRRIPLHKNLKDTSFKFFKTKAALKKAFSDKKPTDMTKEISDTSLMLRFIEEFNLQKPSYKLQYLVIFGGKVEEWTEEIMEEFILLIEEINYPTIC